MERVRLLPNGPHSIKLGVSLSPHSRCWCCSPPPKSKSSSPLVGSAQWALRGVPWFAVSPIRASRPAPLVRCPLWVISGHMQCNTACPLYPESGHGGDCWAVPHAHLRLQKTNGSDSFFSNWNPCPLWTRSGRLVATDLFRSLYTQQDGPSTQHDRD